MALPAYVVHRVRSAHEAAVRRGDPDGVDAIAARTGLSRRVVRRAVAELRRRPDQPEEER